MRKKTIEEIINRKTKEEIKALLDKLFKENKYIVKIQVDHHKLKYTVLEDKKQSKVFNPSRR